MEHDIAYITGLRWARDTLSLFMLPYICDGCVTHNTTAKDSEKRATSFKTWDPACLERLLRYVSNEFPFILTHQSGIGIRLVYRLADSLVHGKGFDAAAKCIGQAHWAKYMVDHLKHVSLAETRRSSLLRVTGAAPEPQRFGGFDDRANYFRAELSDHYMLDMWRMWFSALLVLDVETVAWTREDYLHRVH
eukprot:jgi/Undpi1/4781/HiC_scaffold_19.g08134.m1